MVQRGQRGFTLSEVLIVVALLTVMAALAMPILMRARQAGNQSSAIGSLRAINSAQHTYSATCGGGYYAPRLTVLGRAPATGIAFVSDELGAADVVTKSGYQITMGSTSGASAQAPASCNGQAAGADTAGYWATATPMVNAGVLAYGTNASSMIYKAEQLTPLAMTDLAAPAGAQILDK